MLNFGRIRQMLLLFLIVQLSALSVVSGGGSTSAAPLEGNPFRILTDYLLRSDRKNKEFIKFSPKEVETTIKKLADGQKAMKNMDGASHMINNALSDKKSSLTARYRKFEELDLEQESKSMQKEASKVLEYINTVERGMQACEILQCINEKGDEKRSQQLSSAGLKEIKRVTLTDDKLSITMSILSPIVSFDGRFAKGEVILAFVDACGIESLLRMCTKPTESVPLKSVGLLNEEVTLLPVILELAMQGIHAAREVIMPAQLQIDDEGDDEKVNGRKGMKKSVEIQTRGEDRERKKGKGLKKGKKMKDMTKKKKDVYSEKETVSSFGRLSKTHSISGTVLPQKVRVVGHSAGGAVASYIAMFLDGVLSVQENDHGGGREVGDLLGMYKDRVRCITLASPPCISRNIVPRYVSSLICGDDIISRAHEESLSYMRKRVLSSLQTSTTLVGKIPGSTFLSDMAAVAGKGMSSYTGNAHDLESVHVPGRVFFMKNRKHKNGVSFQRVLRGNWREDMLWMLRDILLSKRMFEHHSLDSYIKTLMRC